MHTRPGGTYHMPRSLGSRPGPRIVKSVFRTGHALPWRWVPRRLNGHRSNNWGGEIGRDLRRGGLLRYPLSSASSPRDKELQYVPVCARAPRLHGVRWEAAPVVPQRPLWIVQHKTAQSIQREVYEMPSSRRVELENSQRCRIAELSANHGTSAWSPLSGTNETTRPGFILTVAVWLAAKQRKVRIQNRHRNALPLLQSVSPRAETMREIT